MRPLREPGYSKVPLILSTLRRDGGSAHSVTTFPVPRQSPLIGAVARAFGPPRRLFRLPGDRCPSTFRNILERYETPAILDQADMPQQCFFLLSAFAMALSARSLPPYMAQQGWMWPTCAERESAFVLNSGKPMAQHAKPTTRSTSWLRLAPFTAAGWAFGVSRPSLPDLPTALAPGRTSFHGQTPPSPSHGLPPSRKGGWTSAAEGEGWRARPGERPQGEGVGRPPRRFTPRRGRRTTGQAIRGVLRQRGRGHRRCPSRSVAGGARHRCPQSLNAAPPRPTIRR